MKSKKKKFYIVKKNTVYIYCIRELCSNKPFYIGVTMRHPEIRLKEHIRKNRLKSTAVNTLLHEEFKKIFNKGSTVAVEILEELTQGILESYYDFNRRKHEVEMDLIYAYKPKCNIIKPKKRKEM